VPSEIHVPAHSAWVVTAHVPSGAQQDPVAGTTPTPSHITDPRDSFPVLIRQYLSPAVLG
jgi:hypothetical protein